jgi:nitrogen regulatory protein PII
MDILRGHGKQKGHTAIYRGKEYNVSLLPKMQIDVVVPDRMVADCIRAAIEAARTGEIGDGRVFVMPVEQSYKIRTGERDIDLAALQRRRVTAETAKHAERDFLCDLRVLRG